MEQDNKTFTQDELNAIIGERLAKEKSKFEAELMKREQALAQRELQMTAKEQLTARSLPHELVEALNISSPESLKTSMQVLETVIQKIRDERPDTAFTGMTPGVGTSTARNTGAMELEYQKAMGLK